MDKYMKAAYFARFAKNHRIEPMALADLCRLANKVYCAATIVANAGVSRGYLESSRRRMTAAQNREEKLRRDFDRTANRVGLRSDHAGRNVRPQLFGKSGESLILPSL